MQEPPLHWSVETASVAHAPAVFSYEAGAAELAALKRYAGVEEVTSFKAEVRIVPLAGARFRASGTLRANAVQLSVADLSAVPACIEEDFSVEYWPAESIGDEGGAALPFDRDAPEPIAGGRIDAGSFLCELFVLSLDPYPRNEGDRFEWQPALPEPEDSPFAELARLRPRKTPSEK